jgi:hypothetical protein
MEIGGPQRRMITTDGSRMNKSQGLLGWGDSAQGKAPAPEFPVRRLTAAATLKKGPQITQNTQKLTCSRRRKSAESNVRGRRCESGAFKKFPTADPPRRMGGSRWGRRQREWVDHASIHPGAHWPPVGGAELNSDPASPPPHGGGHAEEQSSQSTQNVISSRRRESAEPSR